MKSTQCIDSSPTFLKSIGSFMNSLCCSWPDEPRVYHLIFSFGRVREEKKTVYDPLPDSCEFSDTTLRAGLGTDAGWLLHSPVHTFCLYDFVLFCPEDVQSSAQFGGLQEFK